MAKLSKIEQTRANIALKKENRPLPSNVKVIKISDIEINLSRQPRTGINKDHVDRIYEALEEQKEVFPVDVYSKDGRPPFFLADGFHRVEANRLIGFKDIKAVVHSGDTRDAWLHSLQANTSHGLPLTNADKRKKVNDALSDEEMAEWSSTRIAEACGVSHTFVQTIEKEREQKKPQVATVSTSKGDSKPEKPKTKVGKDGKRQSSTKKKPEKVAEIVRDSQGNEVPKNLLAKWETYEAECNDIRQWVNGMRAIYKKDTPFGVLPKRVEKMFGELIASTLLEVKNGVIISPHKWAE